MNRRHRGGDVLVVGAGAIGASVALHLGRLGMSVQLLDGEAPPRGRGTSGRSFGLIWAQSKAPNTYLELSLASVEYYPDFLASLGDDCDYRRPGGLILIETEGQRRDLRELMQSQTHTPGFVVDFLDAAEVRDLEPALSDNLLGATFSPHDGHIDPRKLVFALHRACESSGVRITSDAPVTRAARRHDAWMAETSVGVFEAAVLVNCAGAWAAELARMVGADLPIEIVRGQIVVSTPQPHILSHPSLDLRQAPDGRVWMGTIHQHGDRSLETRPEDTRSVLRIAERQVPRLSGVTVERVWAGLRGVPVDGHPIIGAIPGLQDAYVAVGHSGITLSPIAGKLTAELIATRRVPELLRPFGPERASLARVASHVPGDEPFARRC
ncbi:MAG: NAD(P)/FAD-dependent oxidoreductase [Candidatus Limnocylindria bacterium]